MIAHSDLPLAADLAAVATAGTITIVPDRAGTGTNVLSLPIEAAIAISYGAGSFDAHVGHALRCVDGPATGLRLEVRRDPRLALDVDRPDDLVHPALRNELPAWLQTILANRR